MNSKVMGGLLLIVGTSIGGGMLALPVANAAMGFWLSTLFLCLCWALMTLGALFILEVTLYLPPGHNMVSMAAKTLGAPGLLITWLSYLMLLYTLLSAYISGGTDILGGLLLQQNIQASDWKLATLFTLFFGLIVYGGIRQVDWLNRALMFGKLGVYLILALLIAPYVHMENLQASSGFIITGALMVSITSFGFAIIVPNLRDYFNDDVQTLKKLILMGSLIPLLCYIAWNAVIMGSLPSSGESALKTLMNSGHPTSMLALKLSNTVNNETISTLFNSFTSICMLTAFLGVSLCLMSFLADGLNMRSSGHQGFGLFLLTFLPPLFVVLFYPGAYMSALHYAGFCCVILLLLLPALMSFFGRKHHASVFVVPGGRLVQLIVIILSLALLVFAQ